MHAISAKLYEAAAAEMAEQEEAGAAPSDDGVVDADFEISTKTKTITNEWNRTEYQH